jgi:outer membrane protein OmpA-like peptidoglycan-associated protein
MNHDQACRATQAGRGSGLGFAGRGLARPQRTRQGRADPLPPRTNVGTSTATRRANGAGINVGDTKFTDAKIVTHGINFDTDKATLKPESMGTFNMVAKILKDNPEVRFEIQGHTDNSGAAAHNLALSQQRAEAVKLQLVSMGVDTARLTTKGLGDTRPIADNATFEGRANNRRVEFVRLK